MSLFAELFVEPGTPLSFGPNFDPRESFGSHYATPNYYAIQNDVTVINPTDKSLDAQPAAYLVVAAKLWGVTTAKGDMIATIGRHSIPPMYYDNNKFVVYISGKTIEVTDDRDSGVLTVSDFTLQDEYNQNEDPLLGNGNGLASCLNGRVLPAICALAVVALVIGAHKQNLLPFGKTTV